MKKLLAMILMASFTLPVFAKEVTLRCKIITGNEPGKSEIMGFDEANGTVTIDGKKFSIKALRISTAENENVENYKYYPTRTYFITPTDFGFWQYGSDGQLSNTFTIRRMDGEYRFKREGKHHFDPDIGTCVPFKQAF